MKSDCAITLTAPPEDLAEFPVKVESVMLCFNVPFSLGRTQSVTAPPTLFELLLENELSTKLIDAPTKSVVDELLAWYILVRTP